MAGGRRSSRGGSAQGHPEASDISWNGQSADFARLCNAKAHSQPYTAGWCPVWSPVAGVPWEAAGLGQEAPMPFPVYVPVPPSPHAFQGGQKGRAGTSRKGRGKGSTLDLSKKLEEESAQKWPRTRPVPQTSQGMLHERFREEVLLLRKARAASSAQEYAMRMRRVLLEAEVADKVLDGPLLGMAAANAARLRVPELLEAICAYASCRLKSLGGREVAEMASAALKLERLSGAFARAVAEYCAEAPPGAFKSLRDVSMAATVLFQSLRSASSLSSSLHGPALRGLARIACLLDSEGSLRDAVELAHALAHACEANPLVEGIPLHQDPDVEAALSVTLSSVRRGLHGASAFDVAMAAGAAAAVWSLLPQLQGSTLRPLLMDSASAARFRRADFGFRDLALLAGAFAKSGLASNDLVGVLNDRTQERMNGLSNRDISYFLWAASEVEEWATQPFVTANMQEIRRRDLTAFNARDLSTLATAMSRLGDLGIRQLADVLEEAFRRQLLGFLPRDRAALLAALGRNSTSHEPLTRLLVRGLANESHELDRELQRHVLVATARLWPALPQEDPAPRMLTEALCLAQPWQQAGSRELVELLEALEKLPHSMRDEPWLSVLQELDGKRQDLCPCFLARLVCALAPADCDDLDTGARSATGAAQLQHFNHSMEELEKQLNDGESVSQETLQTLANKLSSLQLQIPPKLAEQLSAVGPSGEPFAEPAPEARPVPPVQDTLAIIPENGPDSRVRTVTIAEESRPRGARSRRHKRSTSPRYKPWHDSLMDQEPVKVTYLKDGLTFQPHHFSRTVDGHRTERGDCDCHEEDQFCGGFSAGHGHSHGHSHDPTCTPCIPRGAVAVATAQSGECGHCVGHEDCDGHGHGGHATSSQGGCCAEEACCLPLNMGDSHNSEVMRLNKHCGFKGHCVQLKHTFIHIPCNIHDSSDSESEDCFVCRLTRGRTNRTRSSSF